MLWSFFLLQVVLEYDFFKLFSSFYCFLGQIPDHKLVTTAVPVVVIDDDG